MISDHPTWKALEQHAKDISWDLKSLLADENRCHQLFTSMANNSIHLDFSRQLLNTETLQLLESLARAADLNGKIEKMFSGEKINLTENRAALHVALRSATPPAEVALVKERIKKFSSQLRTKGELTDVVCVGIGGSYLGPEFIFESLRTLYPQPGRKLRFLANVDPIDVARALEGMDPKKLLVIIISKTFTTAETMLNARTLKEFLLQQVGPDAVKNQMVAVSTALDKTKDFGISDDNVFGFWDWVGGRFSGTSAVGLLPLSVHFGWEVCEEFLRGARTMDDHFLSEKRFWNNIPVIMGLCALWNSSFLKFSSTALLPYCQALARFPAYVQQVDMESNGKRVDISGETVPFQTGPVIFGEPGTNGQHSFYQLLHQGTQVIPAEFIGFKKSQNPIHVTNESVSNHDELMSNFFAQPDALALGSANSQNPHKHFPGNRPSLSLLMPVCDAFHIGTLMALYEHRTVVQSFVWGCNPFDQWGVELGKALAKDVREYLRVRSDTDKFPKSTKRLLDFYTS